MAGITLVGKPNGDVLVLGNRIGTDPAGLRAVPNGTGILVANPEALYGFAN